ncbi:MAG TPA: hypothetical protein VEB21_02440 [Terriglobales bacterium]|nr:hypothetical protein [Terriglobales bacterium]
MRATAVLNLVLVTTLFSALPAVGQLSETQRACVLALNKDAMALAAQQGKESLGCIKAAGKQTLIGNAQDCLTADLKLKLASRKTKTIKDAAAYCAVVPPFGYTGAAVINDSAPRGELDLVADVFGASLDAALASCRSDSARCKCQQQVAKNVAKLAKSERQLFLKCKKQVVVTATSASDLEACVDDTATPGSITAARLSGGKIAKAVIKLGATVVKHCDVPMVAGAFPGACDGQTGAALATCLAQQVDCRVCQTLNDIDGLSIDCDAFDDGTANASCADSGVPQTPTLTPTSSVTATVTPTPTATVEIEMLTINFPGGGLGRVQDVANGIDCTDTCTVGVASGSSVQLTVTSTNVPDGTFWGWGTPCDGTGPCNLQVTESIALDAIFLSTVVQIGLGDGPFIGQAPPDYTHSRDARLRLRNNGRARSVAGLRRLDWSTSPDELRPVEATFNVLDQHDININFPAQIWDIFDVYTISLALWDISGPSPVQISSDAFNVFLSGDVFEFCLVEGWPDPCPTPPTSGG